MMMMAPRTPRPGSAPAAAATAPAPAWGPAAITALPVVLALGLLALWITPTGGLRGVHWEPPAPLLPELSSPAAVNLQEAGKTADAREFQAILDRPIFSPDRRPPPVVTEPTVAAAPPPDPLEKVRILGVFAGAAGTGVIAQVDGKPHRLMQGEAIGAWNLTGVAGSDVTFRKGGETRVLSLVKPQKPAKPGPATYVQGGVVKQPPVEASGAAASTAAGASAVPGAPGASRGVTAASSAAGQAAPPPPAMPARAPGLPIPMPDGSLRMP